MGANTAKVMVPMWAWISVCGCMRMCFKKVTVEETETTSVGPLRGVGGGILLVTK